MSLAAVIFVSLMTTAVGQSSTATPPPPPAPPATAPAPQQPADLPVSLDKIRKALDEKTPAAGSEAPKLRVDTASLPVFRTQTSSTGIALSSVLADDTGVGAYVHPPNGPYDYEFKQMVTPDAVKGCGRLSQRECIQSYANQFVTGLLWQRAMQARKSAGAPATPAPPDAETQRIRAQIQQELLDQQSQSGSPKTPPPQPEPQPQSQP